MSISHKNGEEPSSDALSKYSFISEASDDENNMSISGYFNGCSTPLIGNDIPRSNNKPHFIFAPFNYSTPAPKNYILANATNFMNEQSTVSTPFYHTIQNYSAKKDNTEKVVRDRFVPESDGNDPQIHMEGSAFDACALIPEKDKLLVNGKELDNLDQISSENVFDDTVILEEKEGNVTGKVHYPKPLKRNEKKNVNEKKSQCPNSNCDGTGSLKRQHNTHTSTNNCPRNTRRKLIERKRKHLSEESTHLNDDFEEVCQEEEINENDWKDGLRIVNFDPSKNVLERSHHNLESSDNCENVHDNKKIDTDVLEVDEEITFNFKRTKTGPSNSFSAKAADLIESEADSEKIVRPKSRNTSQKNTPYHLPTSRSRSNSLYKKKAQTSDDEYTPKASRQKSISGESTPKEAFPSSSKTLKDSNLKLSPDPEIMKQLTTFQQPKTMKLWTGDDKKRTKSNIIDLDVVSYCLRLSYEQFSDRIDMSDETRAALSELVNSVKHEVNDTINKVEEVKEMRKNISQISKQQSEAQKKLAAIREQKSKLRQQLKGGNVSSKPVEDKKQNEMKHLQELLMSMYNRYGYKT